jgi:hypothetical protein
MSSWQSRTAVTLDVDWAPDYAIDFVAARLLRYGVAATWFVTHASDATERLRQRSDLFELGIHPNFLPGSTHGEQPADVLAHCMSLVPEARTMRTHGLVQSSALLGLVRASTPIAVDVSLFLPHARHLTTLHYPLEAGSLLRIPFIWEDDAEMYREQPDWRTASVARSADGLAVFCFHPIHVYLNSPDMQSYRTLAGGNEQRALELRHDGEGAGTAFVELLEALGGARGATIGELAREPVEAAA